MGKVLLFDRKRSQKEVSVKGHTDNYFRVGRNVYLFCSKDIVSAHRAWNEARAASEMSKNAILRGPYDTVAVYRPFPLQGPWWNCDVIGFMPPGEAPTGDDMAEGPGDTWIERTELRKALWAAGACHVNGMGLPVTGA